MSAWYVFAEREHGAYRLPLVGPFKRYREALAMEPAVRAAVERMRPDLADATIRSYGPLDTNRAGVLSLDDAVDDAWIEHCIRWRVR
jgi:hypothetical protein